MKQFRRDAPKHRHKKYSAAETDYIDEVARREFAVDKAVEAFIDRQLPSVEHLIEQADKIYEYVTKGKRP